jgi:predicted transcriptional regulator
MGQRQKSEWIYPSNRVFRLLQSSKKHRLGPLEQQVLFVLWRRGSATVKEVIEYGDVRREYNTVMTTLDRLYKKRLADRTVESNSRAFRYVPCHRTQLEWQREFVIETVKNLLSMDTRTLIPLSYLVEAVSEHDAGLLDDLQRLVDEKRQKVRAESPEQVFTRERVVPVRRAPTK